MVELRADAQRNLGRVLDAAAEVFAERGPDASVDEIARRAGVGHGTVFRRFPTKDSLVAAVMCRRLAEISSAAEDLLEQPEAGEAFEQFIWEIGERFARDHALFEGAARCAEVQQFSDAKRQLEDVVERLVLRAQEQGSLRRDIDAPDVLGLVSSAMQGAMRGSGGDAWRRYVAVVLDGLRVPAPAPAPATSS
jgi:AcrR family transcriptional regulator